ncbi:hypothetical protein QPK80_20845, partial [Providencia rettgeri]|nr:hypothetical protein [Providencia rettgeri]
KSTSLHSSSLCSSEFCSSNFQDYPVLLLQGLLHRIGEKTFFFTWYIFQKRLEKKEAHPFLHRLRPPDELHKIGVDFGAQAKNGETWQDYKDPHCFQ